MDELAGERRGLLAPVAVGAEDEVRLQAGHVAVQLPEVLDELVELGVADAAADAACWSSRSTTATGRGVDAVGVAQPVQRGPRKDGERALHQVGVAVPLGDLPR